MLDLAVIIVTWNNADVIYDAIHSLLGDLQSTELQYQVWVVDSASSDNTADIIRTNFPDVHLVKSDQNLGFSRANNLAMYELGFKNKNCINDLPRAVYLLNPDTITHKGATKTLYDTLLSHEKVGGCWCKVNLR